MSGRLLLLLAHLMAASLLGGCGDSGSSHDEHRHEKEDPGHEHGHEHSDAGDEPSGAGFEEGLGILMDQRTRESLGLRLADAVEKDLRREVSCVAQVYREGAEKVRPYTHAKAGYAYASAMVNTTEADRMRLGQPVRVLSADGSFPEKPGSLVHIERELDFYTGRTEILVEIADPDNAIKFGSRLNLLVEVGARAKALVVPESALLRASTGDFVYKVQGNRLLRTAVRIGTASEGEVEITEGLKPGDQAVIHPVESLWLIELRATKGGGHSH